MNRVAARPSVSGIPSGLPDVRAQPPTAIEITRMRPGRPDSGYRRPANARRLIPHQHRPGETLYDADVGPEGHRTTMKSARSRGRNTPGSMPNRTG
ncbi:hypothetical protein EBB59_10010 [Lysobacter pythonis]|uniref:Uncharacterized protein n=1 Tax=Solilutibacter pythonis TaxID=2483112 RepID=A0A3M2HSX4_9GAMM|nr:hypothetical protein [Lysobacter pythonis]RMH90770.1 hypothetical protein EBB59_10010 [Lysobacter pythonis]